MADELTPSVAEISESMDSVLGSASRPDALSREYDVVTGVVPSEAPATSKYAPLFSYDDANQTDRDFDGRLTQRIGAARGLDFGPDKVLEVNLFGEVASEDTVRSLDGGAELLSLLARKRQGRRGFTEALTTGAATDFIPYVGDLASTGIAIKNMKVVRDAFKKMSEQGPQALTLQEKVLTKLYSEDMERQSNQTFGGTVGTILRQAPAFAGEFLLTGGLFKAGSKLFSKAAKETAEAVVESSTKRAMKKLAAEKIKTAGAAGIKNGAVDFADDVAKLADDVFANAVKGGATEADARSLRTTAEKTAMLVAEAYKNPSKFKNIIEFVGEYGRRGVLDHAGDVMRDMPASVAGKLREAAGVALVEAPIKGFLYSAFDFFAVNPAVSAIMGADEAVTKTELGLYSTGDKELMDNAKMLAFGTAVAEYASESSGRAFNALGGLLTENAAGQVLRKAARSGLRARADFVNEGSVAKRLFDAMSGPEDQLKPAMARIKQEAVEAAVKANSPVVAGKSVGQVLADSKLTDQVMKGYLGFRDKSFLGYWVANKALDKGITPQAVTRLMENMGYDEILGEFMEERYNGFAQGLFGLDGKEHDSNLERIAHAFKEATPSFKQGAAEILAFAVPTLARSATNRAYEFLGAGNIGKMGRVGEVVGNLKDISGLIVSRKDKPAKFIDIRRSDADSGSAVSVFTAKAGKVEGTGEYVAQLDSGVDALVDAIGSYTNAREDKVGLGVHAARAVLGIMNFMITGNPIAAFHNPMRAIARQKMGEGGAQLLNYAAHVQKSLYVRELARRAGKTADEIEASGEAAKLTEAGFNDPSILEAIRPDMRSQLRYLLKEHLRTAGTVIVEDEDVDRHLDEQMKAHGVDGKLAGLTREEFREKFFDELAGAAAGRMTMDVQNGRVHTVYRRTADVMEDTTYGHVASSVEEFLNKNHIASFMHGAEVTDVAGVRRNLSGTPIDIAELELARGTGQGRDSAAVERARMNLVMKMFPNPQFGSPELFEMYMSRAAHTAAVLLETNKKLLRPQFDLGGRRVEVGGEEGAYTLSDAAYGRPLSGTGAYATIEEAAAAASGLGATPRKAQMYFTSSNTFVAPYAAMLLSGDIGARGYLARNADFSHEGNPFMNPELSHAEAKKAADADIALGTAWETAGRLASGFKSEADAKAAKDAYERALADVSKGGAADGYETRARKAAEAAGIKRFGVPDARGERGFIFEPAAISHDGAVYVSYARMSSTAAIIEDSVEAAVKRNIRSFLDPRVPVAPDGTRRNSPVVRKFMETAQNALQELIEDQSKPLSVRDEARYLSDLFDPVKFELEAVSHAATAFVFYQGDSAKTAGSGSALYATLGYISKKVRGNLKTYPAFASLVNRAAGGGMLGVDGGVLAPMTSAFLHPNLRDKPDTVRDRVEGEPDFRPESDAGYLGEQIASSVKIALSGTPLSGFISEYGTPAQKNEQAFYKREIERLRSSAVAGGNVREYLDEELPFLLEEIKGARNADMIARGRENVEAAEKPADAAEAAAVAVERASGEAAEIHKERKEDASASWATEMLTEHPAFAVRLGEAWLSKKTPRPDDKRGRLERVFDEWTAHDPLLTGDDRRRFMEAVEKAGLLAKSAGVTESDGADTMMDPAFATRFDQLFNLGETYDEGETQNRVDDFNDEEGVLPVVTEEVSFDDAAAARDLENDSHVSLIRGVIHANTPAAQRNDHEALRMLFDASSSLYPKGSLDTRSVASLFDWAAWTSDGVHPALVDDASFAEWLGMERPEDGDPMFDDLLTTLRVIGLPGVFKAADKMKGSYVKTVYSMEAEVDADGNHVSATLNPRVQSLSAEVSESLLRGAKAEGRDPEAALAMLNAEVKQGLGGRLGRLADAADLLFGKNNFVSQVLRKDKVRARVSGEVALALADRKSGGKGENVYTGLFERYVSKSGKFDAPVGLFALRMAKAARLLSDGKPEEAVREFMRGDALSLGEADNRGAIPAFLNDAASLIPVASAQREGEGAGKVRAIDPAMSTGALEFLLSDGFAAAYAKTGGKAETLRRAVRFGEWADGTPVFAAISGLTRRAQTEEEVDPESIPAPSYAEVGALAELHYNSGVGAYTVVALYNGDKDMERLVNLPRAALKELTGSEKEPTYAETLKAVSKLMRISELSPKRVAHHTAGGAAVELQNAQVALLLSEDQKTRENLHGVGYIGSAALAGYYRRQGFGSAAKVILTESPVSGGATFFAKGQFVLADKDDPDGSVSAAEADMRRIAKDYAYLSDMDSFKETALYYKADDKRTVLDMLLAGDTSAEVTLPDGTRKTVSDIAAELGADVMQDKVNGNPVTVVSIRMGLRSQWASAPSKLAAPKSNEVPVNYLMDNKGMWPHCNAQAKVRAALSRRLSDSVKKDVLAVMPDGVLRLLDAGVSPKDPDIMKVLGPKLASRAADAYRPTMTGVQYLNRNFDGARILEDAEGRPYLSDPFGGLEVLPSGLIHDTYMMADGTRRLASTAVNLGGATSRYGLRADAAKLGASDAAGIMEAVRSRVLLLKAAELRSLAEGDDSIYLRAYAEHIDGVFTDHNGNPLPAGQLLSFSDLVDRDGVFDSARLYESVDDDGTPFVFLNGQINISGRTPSRDGKRAEYAHYAAMPAYMEEADGSQYYMALSTGKNGEPVARRIYYPEGTLVPGKDAVIKMTPWAKHWAGSDEDWDKSHSQRLPTDRLGRERLGVEDAEAKIGSAKTDGDAERIADLAIAGLESMGFWAAVESHRTLDAMTNPVTATPFTKAYQDAFIPKRTNPKLDTVQAAAFAAQNKEAQTSRAISVAVLGNLSAAVDVGMTFVAPIREPMLRKPDGAKAAYWDGGFMTGPKAWSRERLRAFVSAGSGVANSTFDDMKESLAARAGFRPEFLDLYLYLAFESGAETQEAYEAFHTAFMEWADGPEGRLVSEAYRNEAYPAAHGGTALAARLRRTTMELYDAADAEADAEAAGEQQPYRYRMFRSLSVPHRNLVTAIAVANGGGTTGFDAVFGTVLGLDRLRRMNAVGGVLAYKKANTAFVDKVDVLDGRIETVLNELVDSDKAGVTFSAEGRQAVIDAMVAAAGMAEDSRDALSGAAEASAVYKYLKDVPLSKESRRASGLRSAEAAKRVVNSRLPFEAAVLLTPPAVGAKIDAIRAGAQKGRATADFLAATESALKGLYKEYAKAKGAPNAALDTLLAPGVGNKAQRIMTTGSDGTAAAAAELLASMEAMRDWTPGDASLPVTRLMVNGAAIEITPADFYWMLMQYCCLTTEKSVETGRATQSLLSAFFGPAVYRKISDYQIAAMRGMGGQEAESLMGFTRSHLTDFNNIKLRQRPVKAIPDGMAAERALRWGGYEAALKAFEGVPEEVKDSGEEAKAPEPLPEVAAVRPDAVPEAAAAKPVTITVRPGLAAAITAKETAKYGTGVISGVIAAEGTGGQTQHAAEEAKAQGALNPSEFTTGATYVVVIPGKGRGFTLETNGRLNPPYDKVVAALESGAVVRTDNKANAFRSWNADGEGALYSMLSELGYAVRDGASFAEWARTEDSFPAEAAVAQPQVADVSVTTRETHSFTIVPRGTPGAVYGMRGPGGQHMNTPGMLPGVPGWLGNPVKWAGNGGTGPLSKAIEGFRELFLAKVGADPVFRRAILALRGREVEYYRPADPNHLQVVQDWLAAQPQSQIPADHTPESAAWKNIREQAKAVSAMTHEKGQRRLYEFARAGTKEIARMTDESAVAASGMGASLLALRDLQWVKEIPGSADTLAAADTILRTLRFPEPAVFLGAVRALGRSAVSAGSKDAVDQLVALFKECGAARSADNARLDSIIAESAKVLAAPAAVRVMEFAAASDKRVSEAYAKVGNETLARGLLAKIGMNDAASASMADSDVSRVQSALVGLPEDVRARVRVIARTPRGLFDRPVDLAKKAWLQERGIDSPVMALWIERNEKVFGLKNWATEADVRQSIVDKLADRTTALLTSAEAADKEEWGGDVPGVGDVILQEAAREWIDAVPLSVEGPAEDFALLDLLLDIPEAGLASGREDKYVEYPSIAVIAALRDYMHKFPNERFNVAKKYAALKNEKVLGSVKTVPASNGKGTWAVVPRADKFAANLTRFSWEGKVTTLADLPTLGFTTEDGRRFTQDSNLPPGFSWVSDVDDMMHSGYGALAAYALRHMTPESLPDTFTTPRGGTYTRQNGGWRISSGGATLDVTDSEALRSFISAQGEPKADDFDRNVAKLRELSPPTWCTHDSHTEQYVSSYDNHVLMVDGRAVAGIEVYPEGIYSMEGNPSDGRPRKRKIHEVTSYANNGVASVDHLDEILAYIRANGWNEDDEAGSIAKAKQYKAQGKTDAQLANEIGGHWAAADWLPDTLGDGGFMGNEGDVDDVDRRMRLDRELEFPDPDDAGSPSTADTHFQVDDQFYVAGFASGAPDAAVVYSKSLLGQEVSQPVTREEYISAYLAYRSSEQERARDYAEPVAAGDMAPFSKGTQGVEGFYDPTADKAVLVASNIGSDARAREVALHEVAHRGLHSLARAVGGEKELLRVLSSAEAELMKAAPELVKKTGHKDLESLVRDYGFDPATDEGRLKLLSELTARWAERFEGRRQEAWWTKLVSAIRDWVTQFSGVTLDEKGVDELVKGVVRLGTQPRDAASASMADRSIEQAFDREAFRQSDGDTKAKALFKQRFQRNVTAAINAPDLPTALAAIAPIERGNQTLYARLLSAVHATFDAREADYQDYMREKAAREFAPPRLPRMRRVNPAPAMPVRDAAALEEIKSVDLGVLPKPEQAEFDFAPSASMAAADELADIIREADADIDAKRDYLYETYAKGTGLRRKTLVTPEAVAARVPMLLGTQPDGRKLLFGHVSGQIRVIESLTGLGKARGAMLTALDLFFKPATGQTEPIEAERLSGKDFGQLMRAIGTAEKQAADALLASRRAAESLSGQDRDTALASVETAERAFFSAVHLARASVVALRPNVNGHPNPLRAQIAALENERITPPADLPADDVSPEAADEAHVSEVSLLDPETGHVDPSDDFRVTFVSSDEWFYGTVFPSFRGADIRDILFDKETLAILPAAIAASNRFEAYLGTDSETGSLRKIKRMKGMAHHLVDGGYVYEGETAADTLRFGRRKLLREQADILSGNAFTDAEFALARWFGNAVWHYLGDGGRDARQALAGEVRFDLPWSSGVEKLGKLVSLEEARRRVGGTGDNRPYAVHELLIRAQASLPAELFPFVETALRDAVKAGAYAGRGNESRAALEALEASGYAVARRRDIKDESGKVIGDELYDVRLAVPVAVTDAVFQKSSAKDKLILNGRLAEDLTLEASAAPLKAAFDSINRSVNALGWAVNGDARMFADAGSGTPFFKGSGAYQYFARKLDKPVPPEYKDAVTKAYESLRDMFPKMKTVDRSGERFLTGAEAAGTPAFARMFNLLRDLHPKTFGDAATQESVWRDIAAGRASGLGLSSESTAWDIAKSVYAGSVAKLHETAWLGGTVSAADINTIGLEAFNRAIGEAAEAQSVDLGREGATFSEIYANTGALPQNLTAGEALALHARQVAEMTRYRAAVNQVLMTAGEDGMPLVYAKPGLNAADDTVPDRMWGMLARWWAETGSDSQGRTVAYDESLSGRENASRIYDLVTAGKESDDATQTAAGGLRRYLLSNVDIPSGMETFSAVKAMKDPAGDDEKARMNAFGGGEAANIVRQVFAIAGYGRPDARLAGMNRALSWSKSASVMASFFFPIATAFESPVAAVGFGPTLLGLSGAGAEAARWMEKNHGWIAKAFGVDDVAKAPFMADILRVIGSDDPALTDLKVHATLSGLNLADRAHNLTDTDRTTLAKDIAWVTAQARALHGVKAAKSLKAMLEGAMEHSSEFAFEYVINATKLAVFAQMNNRMRQRAIAAGRWWDPVRDMKKWANYINAEVGGIDTAMYPWMTPKMQQVLKAVMFSWEWTLGAWEAGGGGVLTQKVFGQTTQPHLQKFMLGRWLRMYGAIMFGLPMAMQLIITAAAKAAGSGDDDDKWLATRNEKGRAGKDFDITPLLRMIADTPVIPFTKFTFGDLKRKEIPVISALIPALTGQEGDKPTTRKRRYYMHMGKQGWEVAGWFENPVKSVLSKMSMPAQKILEGILGVTPSMGWEKPFADLGFWERWTSLDPEKSALLNLGTAVLPFSVMGVQRSPEAGALVAFGPVGKGISKTRAENEMAAMFTEWGDAESYIAMRKGKPGAWTDLMSMSVEWLEALRLNGYDPATSLKQALAKARRPLYEQVHKALPAFPDGKADTAELEAAARGLYRLDFVAKNLMKSIKARDKAQHIKRSGELGDITDALLRDAFENPYGRKADPRLRQSAAGGGDVRKLLASDKLPKTVLGYRVLKTEELSESDLAFFRDQPESPGFYDKETK